MRQVFGEFGVFDASVDVRIDAVVVFDNKERKRFDIAALDACDQLLFVKIKQSFRVPFISADGNVLLLCCGVCRFQRKWKKQSDENGPADEADVFEGFCVQGGLRL